MTPLPIDKPCGLYQEHLRNELRNIFLSENILIKVLVDWQGRAEFITQSWEEYWGPVAYLLPSKGGHILKVLKGAHRQYIASGFEQVHRIRYCYYYFRLMEELLRNLKCMDFSDEARNVLGKVLGFENFHICWFDDSKGLACGTSTVRNPCYLLSKIKHPQAVDDPKFLALITGPGIENETRLFYHYRQYKIDDEYGISILLFPAVDLTDRLISFTVIESFAQGLSPKSDPRAKQRSQIIADSAISPFLSSLIPRLATSSGDEVSFVDIGSGNGALASNIWRRILETQPEFYENHTLSCSMVGLRVQNPLRHFNRGLLRGTISYLDYSQSDYRKWIQEHHSLASNHKYDIALLCRLLNNLSLFEIESSAKWEIIKHLGKESWDRSIWVNQAFEPAKCLKPENSLVGSLSITNSNIYWRKRKTYRHLSLSNYYKALKLLTNNSASGYHDNNEIYFPVRQFNGDSLILPSGESVIRALCNIARLIVIEDVDLTKKKLIEHCVEHKLENIDASQIRKCNSVNSASIFCVCCKGLTDLLPGKKIWSDFSRKIENLIYSHRRNFPACPGYPQ